MAVFLTNEDIFNLNEVAVRRTVSCLGIELGEKTWRELYEEASSSGDVLFKLLDDFIVVYRQWQNLHIYFQWEGKQGQVLGWDAVELQRRMEERDQKRQALLDELQRRGC